MACSLSSVIVAIPPVVVARVPSAAGTSSSSPSAVAHRFSSILNLGAPRNSNQLFQKTGSPVISTRKTFQTISGWEQRRKCFTRIAAIADGNEESEVKENVNEAATLKQLDQQLATLADRDDSPASRPPLGTSTQQVRPIKRQPGEQSKDDAVEWPEFSAGFLGFMGFALLLLTVINNLLYKTFLGPPVVPFRSGDPVLSSADQEPRYRITSASEEREAKAKAAAETTPDSQVISRVAPALSSE